MKAFQRILRGLRACAPAFLAAAVASVSSLSNSQTLPGFPERQVKLVISFPPGGGVDLLSRTLAMGLTELWGQPVVVYNTPGAGGLLAGNTVVNAPADGHTLLLTAGAALTIQPFIKAKMPYNTITDLVPVGLVAGLPFVLIAHPSLKVRTLSELVKMARDKPGQVNYASSGIGQDMHVSTELLQRAAGIALYHIPYKSSALALQDVLAGRVPVMFSALSTSHPLIKDGKLVPLAISSPERSPLLPDVPTVAELGYPGFEMTPWMGVLAPKGTSPALVEKISADLARITRSEAYQRSLVSRGNYPLTSTPQAFAEHIRKEFERNRTFIKSLGIKSD